ncbi:ectomycorrhiza-regulated small secreted protein [Ephemerocybe angulata]|uniref:Ectomycorrhiza-regulated small secreted protein n=1 Tax=Ephemerocybe angulata TaxID=980116 RepID=A0A8H6M6C8_9AGAR|nr:ectomycorrhiza-regulated small secreted protein [Tulosesus angulatus]
MKFAGFFFALISALPTILGASIPEPATFTGTGELSELGGDVRFSTATTGLQARTHGDIQPLEARQGEGAIAAILLVMANTVLAIMHNLTKDDEGRRQFTQQTVQEGRAKYPEYNWVVVHPKHTTTFDGEKGVDWGHLHHEYDLIVGGTVGYEVYWFTGGKFEIQGDRGYLNWAYYGDVISTSNGGATVEFA